jgi:molybdopterin converting factor small subunit
VQLNRIRRELVNVSAAVVTVRLFAALAESHGWRVREMPWSQGMTAADAWRGQTGLESLPPRVLCAINMEYRAAEAELAPGDEVGFFPPVTGGAR